MVIDVLAVVAAAVVLSFGVAAWWFLTRNEPFARPRAVQTPLRARQLDRLTDETSPVTWKR